MLLINLCLFSSLCHYCKFLFDRKHRWVQEKLVLLFHFPDRYLLSHVNPLTPARTSAPPTPFTITNGIVVTQGSNAPTLGAWSNCCVHNRAFCNHLSLNFKMFIWDFFKQFSLKSLEKPINPIKTAGSLCIYKYLNEYRSCILYLDWYGDFSECQGFADYEILCIQEQQKNTRKAVLMLKLYMTSYTFSLATKPSKLPYAKDTKGCDFLGTVLGNPVRSSL